MQRRLSLSDFIKIDGSFGEGGGQILRSSLTMSLITGKPFIINNIRAKRKNPGLAPQHLAAINAAKEISGSVVEGAERNSQTLEFIPGEVKAGDYSFQVNTAGAMPLVFQTVALPLCFQKKDHKLILEVEHMFPGHLHMNIWQMYGIKW